MNNSETPPVMNRNKVGLVLLFAIGLLPIFVAYAMYLYFPKLLPTDTTNEGQLISPPVSNIAIGLDLPDSKWSLIIPVGPSCEADCRRRFYLARQVNVALGKEAPRLRRVLVTVTRTPGSLVERLKQEYRGIEQVTLDETRFMHEFRDVVSDSVSGNYVYLMDPNGNIMMVYSLENVGKPMLKDIKHLLKLSKIG